MSKSSEVLNKYEEWSYITKEIEPIKIIRSNRIWTKIVKLKNKIFNMNCISTVVVNIMYFFLKH